MGGGTCVKATLVAAAPRTASVTGTSRCRNARVIRVETSFDLTAVSYTVDRGAVGQTGHIVLEALILTDSVTVALAIIRQSAANAGAGLSPVDFTVRFALGGKTTKVSFFRLDGGHGDEGCQEESAEKLHGVRGWFLL